MKKIISLVLAVVLCLSLCACGGQQTIEGKGYDSPEAALTGYAQALKTGNVPGVLSTFAVETYVEHFDLAAYWNHMGTVPPSGKNRLDSIDSYTTGINLINRQHEITGHLTNLYTTISMGEDVSSLSMGIRFNGEPYDNAGELMDELMMDDWMATLSKMEFDGTFFYLEDVVGNAETVDKARENLRKQCDYYGCEEIVPLALEIKLDGETYWLCVDVACYNGKWYNLQPFGTVGLFLGAPATNGGICIKE